MTTPTRTKTKKKTRPIASGRRLMKFPQVKGKTLVEMDLSTDTEDHSITLVFRDKTALRFDIQPGFTVFADYADWKAGDVQPIKRSRPSAASCSGSKSSSRDGWRLQGASAMLCWADHNQSKLSFYRYSLCHLNLKSWERGNVRMSKRPHFRFPKPGTNPLSLMLAQFV